MQYNGIIHYLVFLMSMSDWRAARTPNLEAWAIELAKSIHNGAPLGFEHAMPDCAALETKMPQLPGVYFFVKDSPYAYTKDRLYIGSSKNLKTRLTHHHIKVSESLKRGANVCETILIPYPLNWAVEQKLIELCNPELNDQLIVWWNKHTEKQVEVEIKRAAQPTLEYDIPSLSGRPKDLADCTDRLKAANCRVRVDARGRYLSLRATLPPKPGNPRPFDFQQRIPLGLTNTATGLKLAEKEALKLNYLLDAKLFRWSFYAK
jgi:hypothetical protein